MKYKIVADSCTDLSDDMKKKMNVEIAPLTLEIDDVRYIDDDTLDIPAFLEKASKSSIIPKSACPSPDDYLKAYRGHEEVIYVVTLSSELSGSYSTAILAKALMEEEDSTKKIHVFNSRSAAAGQVAITLKIQECIEAEKSFEETIQIVETYIKNMATIFVLEIIDHLQKAGRMSKMKATLANVLNIKLVLIGDKNGEIQSYAQARGMKKAISKMVEAIPEVGTVSEDKVLVITHVLAEDRAKMIKKQIQAKYKFKEIIIVPTKGISSSYANRGGIIMSY